MTHLPWRRVGRAWEAGKFRVEPSGDQWTLKIDREPYAVYRERTGAMNAAERVWARERADGQALQARDAATGSGSPHG